MTKGFWYFWWNFVFLVARRLCKNERYFKMCQRTLLCQKAVRGDHRLSKQQFSCPWAWGKTRTPVSYGRKPPEFVGIVNRMSLRISFNHFLLRVNRQPKFPFNSCSSGFDSSTSISKSISINLNHPPQLVDDCHCHVHASQFLDCRHCSMISDERLLPAVFWNFS